MNRIMGNWKTSIAGVGMLLVTVSKWLSGDISLDQDDVMQLLIGCGFLAGKDASTGSSPG